MNIVIIAFIVLLLISMLIPIRCYPGETILEQKLEKYTTEIWGLLLIIFCSIVILKDDIKELKSIKIENSFNSVEGVGKATLRAEDGRETDND